MKIATWNVNSLKVRLPHVLDWLAANQPDALCVSGLTAGSETDTRALLSVAGAKDSLVLESGKSSAGCHRQQPLLTDHSP